MEKLHEGPISKEIISELTTGSPVILLRHAESTKNDASKGIKGREHTPEERMNSKINKEFRDGPITEFGK